MRYKELKSTFSEMKKSGELPETLNANHIYYPNVWDTIQKGCVVIDAKIKEKGKEALNDRQATTTLKGLYDLFESLKDKSQHNQPRPANFS